jgi:hypothetical protein
MNAQGQLIDAVLEHAMRITNDDTLVLPFTTVPPNTEAAHVALGKLLGNHPNELSAGCPLMSYVSRVPISTRWREQCPPRPDSLWAHRELLLIMYGAPPTELNPYEGLEWLRQREDSDLS